MSIEERVSKLAEKYEDMPADDFVEHFINVVGTKDYCVCDCERNYGKGCLDVESYLNGGCVD